MKFLIYPKFYYTLNDSQRKNIVSSVVTTNSTQSFKPSFKAQNPFPTSCVCPGINGNYDLLNLSLVQNDNDTSQHISQAYCLKSVLI